MDNSQPESHKLQPGASSVQIVWQWVCYGLWEWALVSLSVLLSITLSYYVVGVGVDEFTIYVLAAMVCLLPLAFFVDRVYVRQEPAQKHGFTGVVMVLNAVMVFLATVGGFIAAVISLLSMFVNGGSDTLTIATISSLVVTALAGMLFVRILNPEKLRRFTKIFPWVVLAVAGLTVVFSVAGPIRSLQSTRDDRLIENNIYTIDTEIRNYAYDHRRLPASLNDVALGTSYQKDAQSLIDRKLVTYRPNTKPSKIQTQNAQDAISSLAPAPSETEYYQLCTTFDKEKGSGKYKPKDLYNVGLDHPAGKVCFDQEVVIYGKTLQ